jgi:glyoxylase-like metal-dependent hydrolase (beta-lactamase superfamily II)
VGAPHLVNPEKLLTSASRIYGDMMGPLWGEFLPVPESQLSIPQDNDVIEIGGVCFRALDTPGHAYHHYAYLLDDLAFTGDVGGVRLGGIRHLRLPMPPPEFNLEKWRESLGRLEKAFTEHNIHRVAPTHFGVYTDPDWHLAAVRDALDEIEAWMEAVMPQDPPIEDLRQRFGAWSRQVSLEKGLDPSLLPVQEAANPAFMSADGIQRYWRKNRAG